MNLIPMYVDLEPIAKSKITNPSVLVREDLLVIHLFHAGNSPVKTCAFPILVDQVPNANLEMTGLVQIDPCVLVLLDIVVILWFLVQEVSKNVYFFSKLCFFLFLFLFFIFFSNFFFFYVIGECENDSECRSDQACFNFACKDSCQDACGVSAQCKALNHGAICSCPNGYVGDPLTACRAARNPSSSFQQRPTNTRVIGLSRFKRASDYFTGFF